MNLLASLSLATGLVVTSVSDLTCLFHTPSARSLTPYPTVSVAVDPGLTRMLPPVYFCGESVPLHEEAVARRLVSALARNTNQNQAVYRIRQRAAVFFPIIEPILSRHRIPLDFKYLPLVESALTGMAVSPKGAVGYWQFMPATARELGLSIQPGYDERQNLVKSTNAACRYLRYLYNRLGSWTLAAAAYNNGIGALLGNIRRQQQRDYYYLRLNAETGKYLYRILAFKELFSNYRSYDHLIPERMMAYLSEPLSPDSDPDDEGVLLPEVLMEEATKVAVNTPVQETLKPAAGQTADIPLPNAADVFRGGIKARLIESAGVERGQVWVFHLIRDGMADGKQVEEGDVLYAIVEDVDPKTDKIYLRADRLYSANEKHTYPMNLSAIDASTGRIGIKLPDVDQIKAGWILTWKTL
ncbi:transglycosylase SLT domain-containing protein [Spirosoma sp. HMF3257]|uniref:Lytic transglycosylase domain-containing protein n=1 Tax=Spirosoma telluris TaxID=2183553 RepID=A0A327NJU9_9BACT|nr:transglycosylase SLT domain-containing protein [Spirosoma telluris]RAI75477.1 lytic transglycosylase domain-containing protein [Spirosoma telluris]